MDKAYLEKRRASEKIHERARYFRGRFLNLIAVIERDMALILTEYFCTDDESKRLIFFNCVASAMTLNSKRNLLVEIVKKDYPRYWKKHSSVINDIEKLQRFRNKLAHSIVDVSESALARPLGEGIGFVQWKKGEPIKESEFDDWEVRANMTLSSLDDIKRLLQFKEHPISKKT